VTQAELAPFAQMMVAIEPYDWRFAINGLIVWAIGTLIFSRVMRLELAAIVMFIKVMIWGIYFTFYFDPFFKIGGDDHAYWEHAVDMWNFGLDPIRIWALAHMSYLINADPGRVVFYYYTYVGLYLFGPSYQSPILMNILVSTMTTYFCGRVMFDLTKNRACMELFSVYLSLHWMIIAWSSFLLLKEPLIVALTAGVLYGISWNTRRQILGRSCIAILCLFALLYTRFYLPEVLIGGVAAGVFFSVRSARFSSKRRLASNVERSEIVASVERLLIVLRSRWVIIGILSSIALYFGHNELKYFVSLMDLRGAPYEVIHFLLQPLPWKITAPVSFLLIPSILHWLAIPLTCIGALALWFQKTTLSRIIVMIAIVMTIFYGLVPDIASTRHRAPLDLLFAIMQFTGFLYLLKYTSRRKKSANENIDFTETSAN